MSEEPTQRSGEGSSQDAEWRRRKRIAEIFGDGLPESTRDDQDEPSARTPQTGDDWLRAQVPPHHGTP